MSDVELLREAARLMRERGAAAIWDGWTWQPSPNVVARADTDVAVCTYPEDAAYIASMPPEVALAVADWLDSVGDSGMPPDSLAHSRVGRTICDVDWQHALSVALAYLGNGSESTNEAPVGDEQSDDGELGQ